jgi:hypothetical protein
MSKDGYVYILSNKSMPGLVKIGKSRRGGRHRAKEIYQTGVPTPFHLEFELYTHDCDALESYVHECMDDVRVNDSREFFEADLEVAISRLSGLHLEDYGYQTINEEIADIECDLHSMVVDSGYDYSESGYPHTYKMKDALRFIGGDAVLIALNKHDEWMEQNRKRREESNG